jgi:hypothetical protein
LECVFFPPPGFFDSHMPTLSASESDHEINNALGYNEDALTDKERRTKGKERSRQEKEEELCDGLNEMQHIAVEDGFVTFCCHFKYLGSFVSFNLCDNFDVNKCVTCNPSHGCTEECLELPPS